MSGIFLYGEIDGSGGGKYGGDGHRAVTIGGSVDDYHDTAAQLKTNNSQMLSWMISNSVPKSWWP